jgi:hypothetical protein
LVVTGSERGQVWINDIGNDAGIFRFFDHPVGYGPELPDEEGEPCTFSRWYEHWIDKALAQAEEDYAS